MQKIFALLEKRSPYFWIFTSLVIVGLLGVVDYLTGNEFSFSLFYLIPVSLTAWYVSSAAGAIFSILGAVTWLIADLVIGENYSSKFVYLWNTLIRFGFFAIVSYLMSELHRAQNKMQTLARTDFVTGAFNSRYFHELLKTELDRSSRYKRPFTLVYLDLDNFKQVNDRFGHDEGDKLLTCIAQELKQAVRKSDIVARLGGDEFAVLFPEAGRQEAEAIIAKVHHHISEQLKQTHSYVTFSAGAVTFEASPISPAETIRIADKLMYAVKNSTKNGVRFSTYDG
ncbi:MAG TPA: GGDEF domain-containing protein [Anaerolineales bacterium]|nr:GGDEF domain-containing protein [Anaerolineales bacterium]HMX17945.1 GGDEF domain-containing protein [Anaerolineales bacterium]HNC89031.1 GGDEF domain-containing protein [Anaerolineales bacterium]